jgi:hypothetical protein
MIYTIPNSQQIQKIELKQLKLWTENPRDPFDVNASDEEIISLAFTRHNKKWNLKKLAREMGHYFDFSELPTVVFKRGKPIVYDGNRRVILAKIKHRLVGSYDIDINSLPEFPLQMPCNVCEESIALNNVYRKHRDSGSWDPLERDIFAHKFMGELKSDFVLFDENTGNMVTNNVHLNQRFVKEEVLNRTSLNNLGFDFIGGKLVSKYDQVESRSILDDLSSKVKEKKISTRNKRKDVYSALDPKFKKIIDANIDCDYTEVCIHERDDLEMKHSVGQKMRQQRRQPKRLKELFGGKLYLRYGAVNDLYRDIRDLYMFYCESEKNPNKSKRLSNTFPALIRMSLRLLCETASREYAASKNIEEFIKFFWKEARSNLDKDSLTLLANNQVSKDSIMQLLHTGAHNYSSSANIQQTIAISIIVGAILDVVYGKES